MGLLINPPATRHSAASGVRDLGCRAGRGKDASKSMSPRGSGFNAIIEEGTTRWTVS